MGKSIKNVGDAIQQFSTVQFFDSIERLNDTKFNIEMKLDDDTISDSQKRILRRRLAELKKSINELTNRFNHSKGGTNENSNSVVARNEGGNSNNSDSD